MNREKTKYNTEYLPKEKIWINPKVAIHLSEEKIRQEIPWEFIEKKDFKDVYGQLTKLSLNDPVSNTNWDYIRFINTDCFRPAAIAFNESQKQVKGTKIRPSYCSHIEGTTPYKEFWKEETRRIKYGYEPIVDGESCGLRISGEFYFYLNYCVIQNIYEDENGKQKDERIFPNFLSMDYYWFKELEARENPDMYELPITYKNSLAVAKSRRKGFSFKAAAGAVWITAFKKFAKVLIASDTGYDAALCFKKCMPIIDWITDYTPFGREPLGDTKMNGGWKHIPVSSTNDSGHFIFGYENTKTKKRQGRLSEIMTVSLANKLDKASGEGVQRIYFEESGKINDLKKAWTFAKESLKAGSLWRGIAILFGTGGSMVKDNGEKGSSRDFAELFNNPIAAELGVYDNIYEYQDNDKKCGWFVSDMWSNFGSKININGKFYEGLDKQGNPYFWVAELYLNKERLVKRENGKKEDYDLFLTQRCKTPSEAFLITQGSVFPTADLLARKTAIEMSRLRYEAFRVTGELIEYNNVVTFKPDLEGKLQPLDSYVVDSLDREGCLLRYEVPMKVDGVIPEGAYIISVDPIGQNTISGKSLTSIVVMKTPKFTHIFGPEKIVCTYRGRSKVNPQGYVHELLVKLSKYYNAKITFENDRDGGILQYFIRKGELGRLMSKPEMTLNKYIKGSATNLREFGHSMGSRRHKQIGEDLLLEWLLKRQPKKKLVNDKGDIIEVEGLRYLDTLEDKAVIEELIAYNRDGNFDTVMALMGAIIQINEHYNEDFINSGIGEIEGVSSFWKGLYVNSFGSEQQKYEHNINKSKKQNPEIQW
jgi:hypothetical protein